MKKLEIADVVDVGNWLLIVKVDEQVDNKEWMFGRGVATDEGLKFLDLDVDVVTEIG